MAYNQLTTVIPIIHDGHAAEIVARNSSTSAQTQLAIDSRSGAMTQAEAYMRFVFAHIKSWTLRESYKADDGSGEDGAILPLTFDVFDAVGMDTAAPLMEHVNRHPFVQKMVQSAAQNQPS